MERKTALWFKTLFEQQKRNLIYSSAVMNQEFQINSDDLSDEADLTTTELETSMRMRLRNREALYLKKIEEALLRIHTGTFGQCLSCGDSIEMRRLEARPTTTFCVGCKEEQERVENHHIDSRHPKSLGMKLRLA